MLRPEQKKWIDHLRGDDQIKIVPWDPTCNQKYKKVKAKIQIKLGKQIKVIHSGASALGISGQDEIDIYMPVSPDRFNDFIEPLTSQFGAPRSHYILERARFVTEIEGKHIDIFLINEKCRGWIDSVKFMKYLENHTETLEQYRILKEEGNGLSTREYYRRKIEFINEVLERE